MPIDKRPYEADASEEERRAILDRMRRVAPGIILWRELPTPTLFTIDLFMKKLEELAADSTPYYLLVDLTEAVPRDVTVKLRATLRRRFRALSHKPDHVAIFTGRNIFANAGAGLLTLSLGLKSWSVDKTHDEALDRLHRVAASGRTKSAA